MIYNNIMSTQQFILDRIAATQLLIDAYETAITALATGGVQEYLLDTGQNKQRVTKIDIQAMQEQLDSLYNRYLMLDARLNGSGSTVVRVVRPAW